MPQPMLTNPRAANPTALPFSTDPQRLPYEWFDLVTNSAITGNQPVIHIPHATAPTGKVTKFLTTSDAKLFAGIADTIRWGSGSAAAAGTVRVVTKGMVEGVTSSGTITAGDLVQCSVAADGTVVTAGTNSNPVIGIALNTAASNKVTLYLFGAGAGLDRSGTLGTSAPTTESAVVKQLVNSGTISVTVPSITDPDIAKVDVDVSALTFACAVGDFVVGAPKEALPTNCRYQSSFVVATDTIQVLFGSEGGNVTGAAKNFQFLIFDVT